MTRKTWLPIILTMLLLVGTSLALAVGNSPAYFPLVVHNGMPAATPTPWFTYTPPVTYTPPPIPTPTYTPPSTVSPDLLRIPNTHTTYTSFLYKHIVGEVENLAAYPVSLVFVAVKLYDDQNNLVHEQTGSILAHRIEAGTKACFNIPTQKSLSWTRYELRVLGATGPVSSRPRLVVLDLVPGTSTYGTFSVSGKVRNDESVPVSQVVTVLTMYDWQGRVLDCARPLDTPYIATMNPGETASFTITAYRPATLPARYTVIADGSIR